MNRRKLYFYTALAFTLITLLLLVTGSSLLEIALDDKGTIPLGNLITWGGMMMLPLTVYWGINEIRNPTTRTNTILAGFLKVVIILGILWFPVSYLLAGNFTFSFSEKETFQGGQVAMRWFWRLSYGIAIGSILILIIYWITLLFRKR